MDAPAPVDTRGEADVAPLLIPLSDLPGIGDTWSALIAKAAGGVRLRDLLFHLPESYVDRSARPAIREAVAGEVATLRVQVVRHQPPATPRQPWRVVVRDETGFMELVFFRPQRLHQLPVDAWVIASGRVEGYGDRLTMPHPDHLAPADQPEKVPAIDPVWRLTAGLTNRAIARAMRAALPRIPDGLPEWHDAALLKREAWPAFGAALLAVQAPFGPPAPDMLSPARRRLAYDELLAHQVAIAWVRRRDRHRPGRALLGDGRLRAAVLARFGHEPTSSQAAALAEIDADLASPRRMLRLLQGDVGSGKTLVAMLAMLRAVEAGAQAVLMAPTEVLARQHHRTLSALCAGMAEIGSVGLLTGSVKGVARRNTLLGLASGRARLAVGTHALFQDSVAYRDLALAVIDEQHRFGVDQRLAMAAKGERADILVMTATPIPRTLLLTQWGEMDVSRLAGKPAGRQPIRTGLHSLSTLEAVADGIGRALEAGARAYWVCPMVEESALVDLAAAEARFAALRERFGALVGLAHGRQDTPVREAALADFASGRTRLLVATTVIEVGVDVPEASAIVIEHAERFGLAQLHQLRGRVGRGSARSHCLLLHADGLTEPGRRRLRTLRDTEDGFVIADEDFRLRGGGDMLGTRQSGLPGYRLADPAQHDGLLHMANRDAAALLERDPELATPRGRAVRLLLRLFERGAALRTLHSG